MTRGRSSRTIRSPMWTRRVSSWRGATTCMRPASCRWMLPSLSMFSGPLMRETDPITGVLAAIGVVVVIGPSLAVSRATGWLIDHGLLVPSAADPIVVIPAAGGAGLDARRLLAITAGLVL